MQFLKLQGTDIKHITGTLMVTPEQEQIIYMSSADQTPKTLLDSTRRLRN